MRDPELKCKELPKSYKCRQEVHPDQKNVLVPNAHKHRMDAVSNGHLVKVGSNSKFEETVNIHESYVDFGLMVVDVVYF